MTIVQNSLENINTISIFIIPTRPHKHTVSKYTAMQTISHYFIYGFVDVLRLKQ
jgi:hypothetical protein